MVKKLHHTLRFCQALETTSIHNGMRTGASELSALQNKFKYGL